MRIAIFATWKILLSVTVVIALGCEAERTIPPATTKTQTQAVSTPSCSWVPSNFKGIGDGCDCPLNGDTSCDPDCANNGEGSWCGCDYCFDGTGNEAEDPPPGWEGGAGGSTGTGGSGSGSGECAWIPGDFVANNDGCDCPLNGDTSCDSDCANNGEGSWCGCDYCFDGSGNEAEDPPPGWEGGAGGSTGTGGTGGGASGSGECAWVPGEFVANSDGCDCPLNGDTSCDPDCVSNAQNSWCGCDYCFGADGNEVQDPPGGGGSGGAGGGNSDLIDQVFENAPDGTVTPGAAVGRLPSAGSVSGDGAYVHRIPIRVPQGRAGMQPELSLAYHSRGDNALLGVGWSLTGWSTIVRCRKAYASGQALPDRIEARQVEGIQFDQSDELCLDGQKLLLHRGEYGRAGSEYRTEVDTFSRILLDNEAPEGGPGRFTVYRKNGQIAVYEPPDEPLQRSQLDADGYPVEARDVHLIWPVKTVSDRAGNVVEYRTTRIAAGLPLLDSIHYTQCSGDCGYEDGGRSIEFGYEGREDRRMRFVNGVGSDANVRLSKITTYAPHPQTGATTRVSQYALQYTLSAVSKRSLLSSVTLCDGAPDDCRAAAPGEAKVGVTTRFEWQGEKPEHGDFITLGGEFVEPCTGDICSGSAHDFPVLKFSRLGTYWPQGADDKFAIVDANGDGNDDLVIKYWPHFQANGTWENDDRSFEERIMLGDGDGYFGSSRKLDLPQLFDFTDAIPPWNFSNGRPPPGYPIEGRPPCAAGEIIDWGNAIAVDLDQDGKQELVAPENRECALRDNRYRVYVQRSPHAKIYGNYTVLSLTANRVSLEQISGPEIDTLPWQGTKLLFADLNGDALPDLLKANVNFTPREQLTAEAWEASGAEDEVWQYQLAEAVPGQRLSVAYGAATPSGLSVWNAEPWIGRGNLIVDEDHDGRQELLQQSFGIHRSVALNRDLIPEFHLYDEETSQSLHSLNLGGPDDDQAAVPLWWEAYGEDEPTPYATTATHGTTRFIDINGDGLPDAMRLFVDAARNVGFEVRINTGAGYRAPHVAMLNGPEFAQNLTNDLIAREEREDLGIRIADFNGDGLQDVAYVGNFGQPSATEGGVHIAYSDGMTFSSVVTLPPHELRRLPIYRGQYGIQIAELDGNGLPDIVEMAFSPDALNFGRRQVVTRSRHRLPGGTDLIVAVQDEYGEAESVAYDNLSHRTTRPGGDGRASRFLEPAHLPDTLSDEAGASCAYPAKCVARGSVVRSYKNKRAERDISESYRYFGARSDVTGRGWLGFRKVRIQDEITGRSRLLTFDQQYVGGAGRAELFHVYPNLGAPSRTSADLSLAPAPAPDLAPWVTSPGVPSIAYGISTYRAPTWTATRPLRLVQTDSGTNLFLGHQYGTSGQSFERITTQHDNYGNVWSTLREAAGMSGGNFIQQVDTEFDIRETQWLISLPEKVSRRSYAALGLSCAGCTESRSTVTFGYDPLGLLQAQTVAPENPNLALTTSYGRDSAGLVTSIVEWSPQTFEQRVQFLSYDERGVYPRDFTNALGQTSRTIFDPRVDALAIATDPNGTSVQLEYDGFGRMRTKRAADGSEVRIDYGADSRTVSQLGGAVQKTFHDAHGRDTASVASTFNDGSVVLYRTYDSLGNVIRTAYAEDPSPMNPEQWDAARAEQLASGAIQLSAARFDAGGRIVSSTNGSDETTTFTYPSLFNTRVVDPEGRVSTYDRDVQGAIIRLSQLESSTEGSSAVSATTEYRYAPLGGLAAVYMLGPSASSRREFLYDELGRMTTERGMDGLLNKVITYSPFGDVDRIQDRGMTIDLEHDDLGRVLERRESTTGDASFFTYDDRPNAIGSLIQAVGIDGHTIDYTYDNLGRPSDTVHTFANGAQQRLSIGRQYDELGRLSEIRYPEVDGDDEFFHPSGGGLRVRYEYKNGQLESVLDAGNGTAFWRATDRHALGGMTTGAVNGDGLVSTWTHDPATLRLLTHATSGTTSGQAPRSSFGYDRSGLLTSRVSGTNVDETFVYDRLSRLKEYYRMVDGWIYHNTNYAYHQNGNISSVWVGSSLSDDWPFTSLSTEKYVYSPSVPNLLTRIDEGSGNNSVSFGYDGAGRMLSRTTSDDNEDLTVIGYNSFDLPTAIESSRGVDQFFYDAMGTRVRKTRGLDSVTYVEELYELQDFEPVDASGDRVTRSTFRIFGDSGPIALLSQDWDSGQEAVTYLHHDHQGSVAFRTTGSQSEQLGYFPFGRRMGSWPSPKPEFASEGYTGHSHDDDLGLINMRGRMYDPRTRRFLTPDPTIGMLLQAGGANLYSYVVNNPLNWTDPSGFYPEEGPTIEWWQGDRMGSSGESSGTGMSSSSNLPADYNQVTGPISPSDMYGPSYNVVPSSGPGDVSLGRGAGESMGSGASPGGPSGGFGPTETKGAGASLTQAASPGSSGNIPASDSWIVCSEAEGCRNKTPFEIFGGFLIPDINFSGFSGAWSRLFGSASKGVPFVLNGATVQVGSGVSKVASNFGAKDAQILARAVQIAQQQGGKTFLQHLGAVTQSLGEFVPMGQVWKIGEYGGNPIFGTIRTGIGIVESGGKTMVVHAPQGGAISVLGAFLP